MSDAAQVEVVATVKESVASYRETGQLNLEVLDLRKLDPDVNGDGKISASMCGRG